MCRVWADFWKSYPGTLFHKNLMSKLDEFSRNRSLSRPGICSFPTKCSFLDEFSIIDLCQPPKFQNWRLNEFFMNRSGFSWTPLTRARGTDFVRLRPASASVLFGRYFIFPSLKRTYLKTNFRPASFTVRRPPPSRDPWFISIIHTILTMINPAHWAIFTETIIQSSWLWLEVALTSIQYDNANEKKMISCSMIQTLKASTMHWVQTVPTVAISMKNQNWQKLFKLLSSNPHFCYISIS